MAGRWTFVLVIALACAMVTAQSTPVVGDRLNIFCTEKYNKFEKDWEMEKLEEEFEGSDQVERLGGVLIDQDSKNLIVALDVTGTVMVFDKKGLRQNQACLVKRGIVLNPGDWLKITGTEGTEFDEFENQFGRLGEWNKQNRGFEITLEDTGNVNVFIKGAYFVKSSLRDREEQMAFEGYLWSCDTNSDGWISPGEWVSRHWKSRRDHEDWDSPQFSNIYSRDSSDEALWTRFRSSVTEKNAFWAGVSFTHFDKNLDKKLSETEFRTFWKEQVQHATLSAMRSPTGRQLSEQTDVQV